MLKFLTLIAVMFTSFTVFSGFSTKDQVRAQLWFEGVSINQDAVVESYTVKQAPVKIPEEVLIPLLRMEKKLKNTVQN